LKETHYAKSSISGEASMRELPLELGHRRCRYLSGFPWKMLSGDRLEIRIAFKYFAAQ
jgi:hypothetical protein